MKRPFNDLYGDFFSTSSKKETIKKEKKEPRKPLQKNEFEAMMSDLDTINNQMNEMLKNQQNKINQGIKELNDFNGLNDIDNIHTTPTFKTEYEDVTATINDYVLGQQEAVDQLNTAFKRPYFKDLNAPILNSILLCGPKGTGKHSLIERYQQVLYTTNHLSTSRPVYIDVSKISDETTFIQDVFGALSKERTVVVFENIEACPAVYLTYLSNLLKDGTVQLKNRYSLQNKKLVNAERTLDSNLVSEIKAKKQYFICLSHQSMSKTKQKLGNQFLENILEYVETKHLDTITCLNLLKKDLAVLENQIKEAFHTALSFDKDALTYLGKCYSKSNGYHNILDTLEKFHHELTNYLFENKEIKQLTITCISNHLAIDEHHLFLKKEETSKEFEDIQKEMDEIIGLKNVKDYIYSLKDMIAISQKRVSQGLKGSEVSMHMIFTGNPGTGKTTMARLMARYLKALGILKNGQLIEVTRADLVAQYVGQTAPKTKQVIEASLGGVLFIDEAYSLYRGKEDSFGLEAIDMLVKSMEDYRDEFIVVLAGYTKEMATFLEANSGLKSRFPNTMEFPDYTAQELFAIASSIAKSKDYTIDEEANQKLLDYFEKTQASSAARSGNGRLARNVIEDAILKQASRLMKDSNASFTLLKAEDFDI